MTQAIKVSALAALIVVGSSAGAASFFWFMTGYTLGSGVAQSSSGSLTLGIPARCWIPENKSDYAACRLPSLMGELENKGRENVCYYVNQSRTEYLVRSKAAKWADMTKACDPQFHLDLEWQVILNTKKAAADAEKK